MMQDLNKSIQQQQKIFIKTTQKNTGIFNNALDEMNDKISETPASSKKLKKSLDEAFSTKKLEYFEKQAMKSAKAQELYMAPILGRAKAIEKFFKFGWKWGKAGTKWLLGLAGLGGAADTVIKFMEKGLEFLKEFKDVAFEILKVAVMPIKLAFEGIFATVKGIGKLLKLPFTLIVLGKFK